MDTLLGLRRLHWRATDWAAAAVAGFAAGAVLMVLDLVWSSIFNAYGPWRTSYMIAPIFLGPAGLGPSNTFNVQVVGIALVTHYVLGIVFGLVMGALMSQLRADASPLHAGAAGWVMGTALYLFNFDLLAPMLFPWLNELRGGPTLAAHVVFGVVAALLYRRLSRIPPPEA